VTDQIGEVITRAGWGARYSDGFQPAPEPATEAWLHHSVTTPPTAALSAERAAALLLEEIGQRRFGGGVSYNRMVMPSGRIHAGVSWGRRGAHTRGRNSVSRSWVLVGNHDTRSVTDAQVEAIAIDLVRAWRGGHLTRPALSGGHRDAPGASTACPGRHGMAAIPRINARAAALAAGEEDEMTPQQEAMLREVHRHTQGVPPEWAGDTTAHRVHRMLGDVREVRDEGRAQAAALAERLDRLEALVVSLAERRE
jgi:hypothetical protein